MNGESLSVYWQKNAHRIARQADEWGIPKYVGPWFSCCTHENPYIG